VSDRKCSHCGETIFDWESRASQGADTWHCRPCFNAVEKRIFLVFRVLSVIAGFVAIWLFVRFLHWAWGR
jgi:hypothetical protein